jgi:hypothetical protein
MAVERRPTVTYAKARRIKTYERDRELGLDSAVWPIPQSSHKGWLAREDMLSRTIRATGDDLLVSLEETILRFPSAPIHGLQRLHVHHVRLQEPENFHTYRVLRSCAAVDEPRRAVTRIFLMHVGLNERDSFGQYYQIASRLIAEDPNTVCIVRPFPGHMTRFPFHAFAETPLDRYLWDGSHLFRQFLRYMIETQWFSVRLLDVRRTGAPPAPT